MTVIAANLVDRWLSIVWVGILVFVVLGSIGVFLALRERKKVAALSADAAADSWSMQCYDPLDLRTAMLVVLDEIGLSLTTLSAQAHTQRSWRDVTDVRIATVRAKLTKHTGVQVKLINDESIELLFAIGLGRGAYQRGAEQAIGQFQQRWSAARNRHREDLPEDV